MNNEVIDGILTFDELLEDDYYRSEFEKRVQQRLNIESHSDVKGGENTMNEEVQKPNEGEEPQGAIMQAAEPPKAEAPAPVDDPATEKTKTDKGTEGEAPEPAKEMTAEQFALYNETLRRVSKTAKAGIPERYNAFEDAEVKALVKGEIMAGKTPNVKEIAAGVVSRHTPTPEPEPQTGQESKTIAADNTEFTALKVENALLKAGITSERIDAATKLFIAEGGDIGKIGEFVARYPEWHKQEGEVVFSKAPPVGGNTAPMPASRPALNDFERRVAEVRRKAGLDY